MDRVEYEERIRELEVQLRLMEERCHILMETTSALLFEYHPQEDRMVFIFNYPDKNSRKEIEHYHEYARKRDFVHPDFLDKLFYVLERAAVKPVRDEIEYLGKTAEGEFQWHKACYSSVGDQSGKVSKIVGRIHNIHNSVTERQDMIRKMEMDFLTGLYNKGTATEKISKWLEENPDGDAFMVMLDLDDFKAINDTYGHAFGDIVLKESAALMTKCFSKESILSRFGGDEFIIFVTGESLSEVEDQISRLMERMVEEITGMDWPLHCSVGITARISPEDDFEALFNRADNVMYVAKQEGRNRYFVDRRHMPRAVRQVDRPDWQQEQKCYEKAVEKLARAGQEHVLKYYKELTKEQKEQLFGQIEATDFSALASLKDGKHENVRGVITPLEVMQLPQIRERETEFKEIGLDAIKKGKVGAVLLAGGMGTRLGSDDPKGVYNIGITRDVYIFQRLIENLMDVVKEAGTFVPLYVMTSDKNHEATVKFLEEHDYFGYKKEAVTFFMQEMAPACDYEGKVYLEEKWKISTSPNGNGGWYSSMYKWKVAQKAMADGVEWLNVFAVDNVLQRIADPCFVGAVIANQCEVGEKVVRKCAPDEKIGVVCLEDGRPSIVEYYELTEELMNAKDANGDPAYYYGVILNYLFRIDALERIRERNLPLHIVEKKIPCLNQEGKKVKPEEPNGYKFEQLVLDMIHEMDSCLPFEVERNKEFAPIKNKTGIDSVESARELCKENGIVL